MAMNLGSPLQLFRSTGFVAILLISLVLAVQYAGIWYAIEIIKINKESELETHLADLGKVMQGVVRADALALADRAYELQRQQADSKSLAIPSDPVVLAGAYLDLLKKDASQPQNRLDDLARQGRLRSLTLLDDTGRILLSADEPTRVLAPFDFLELDRDQFESARAGSVAGSLSYNVGASPLKRVYVPIRAEGNSGEIEAVLCLTAGRDYLKEIGTLAKNLRIIAAILTVLVLLIGWVVYRLLMQQRGFERRAAHADRLASMGSLAAGFAHEVRNPLEIIGASAQHLERTLREGDASAEEAKETCHDILEEVERLNKLVGKFLQYSRADSTMTGGKASALWPALESALGMLRRAAEKKGVRLDAPSGEAVAALNGVKVGIGETSLRQIVVNLAMNAIQATPAGGKIQITAEADHKRVRVRVVDNGPGIAPEVRPRLFEPFFTTRREGSGLGLSISHQLAKAVGGSLECEERNGSGGASFLLTLPIPKVLRIKDEERRAKDEIRIANVEERIAKE